MTESTLAIRRFLERTRDSLAASRDASATRAADALTACLTEAGNLSRRAGAEDLPVCRRYLGEALATARDGPEDVRRLAESIDGARDLIAWKRRPTATPADGAFFDGHANATIFGPGLAEADAGPRVGLSLLAPDTQYPDHRHPPEEIYLALSAGAWRQADGPWREPGIGGLVHNPPDILHAMRSADAPLLAVWCLWPPARAMPTSSRRPRPAG